MEKDIHDCDSDIINNLPINVKDTILTCLPLREAVRTSILSKKWRYSWTSIPKLVFDDTVCEVSSGSELLLRYKLISIINQIMLFHQGTILKFSLSHSALKSCPEIDHLVIFLSKSGMEEFNLKLWKDNLYKLPLSFFTCQELTYLNLSSCVFSPPPAFKGFHKLISLKFVSVAFDTYLFENFISSCPHVERLTLINPRTFHCMNISAATLKFLHYQGTCEFLCFENVPLLQSVSLVLQRPEEDINLEEGKACRFDEFFGCIPGLEKLTTNYLLFRRLAEGGVPKKLSNSINLKILILSLISFDALDEVSCLYALISSSPNIQKIQIEVFPRKNVDATAVLEFLNTLDYSDIILDKLQEVRLTVVSGIEPELKFIELLLAKSPMLDTVLIKPMFKEEDIVLRHELLKKLTRFQRTSPMAKILYE